MINNKFLQTPEKCPESRQLSTINVSGLHTEGAHNVSIFLRFFFLFLSFFMVMAFDHLKNNFRRNAKRTQSVISQLMQSQKARIHCEIFLSDYFMKHSLMYISLHLIWFHEIHIKYLKRKPPRLRKNEFKRESSIQFVTDRVHIF